MNFSNIKNLIIPEGSVTALSVGGIQMWSAKPKDTKLIVNSDLYTANNGEYISKAENPQICVYNLGVALFSFGDGFKKNDLGFGYNSSEHNSIQIANNYFNNCLMFVSTTRF